MAAEKRRFEAHVHGVAEINIAVEGSKADVEFRAPADSVMGFEHEAKSDSDKKKRDAALRTVQTKMSQMVLFDPKPGCQFSGAKTEVVEEKEDQTKAQSGKGEQKSGEHREVHGTFSIAMRQASCWQPCQVRRFESFRRSRTSKFRWWATPDKPAPRSRETKET